MNVKYFFLNDAIKTLYGCWSVIRNLVRRHNICCCCFQVFYLVLSVWFQFFTRSKTNGDKVHFKRQKTTRAKCPADSSSPHNKHNMKKTIQYMFIVVYKNVHHFQFEKDAPEWSANILMKFQMETNTKNDIKGHWRFSK